MVGSLNTLSDFIDWDDAFENGGYIPGVRPGKPTAEFLDRTMSRLTFIPPAGDPEQPPKNIIAASKTSAYPGHFE